MYLVKNAKRNLATHLWHYQKHIRMHLVDISIVTIKYMLAGMPTNIQILGYLRNSSGFGSMTPVGSMS